MILTREEQKAYVKRLGIADISAPTKSYLFELQKAHVHKLPWQTLDIFAGKPTTIEPRETVQMVIAGRSGYCFHLNGAFAALLRSLGYKVSMHRAGVQPLGEAPRVNSFHLGLTVQLTNDAGEEETWLVDVGLGDMPAEPLPMRFGVYEQSPYTHKLLPSSVAAGGWRLDHDPEANFAGVDFAPEVVEDIRVFQPNHEHYCHSADSPWINLFLIRNRSEQASNELRGCIWRKHDKDGIRKTEIESKAMWLELLGDIFGEHLVRYNSLERDAIWQKVCAKHEEWKRAQEREAGRTETTM
ncbi:arylamine N-acetyltransferase [Brevibacillus sp. HD1.4A]|uniref:arylamine N-acetyltransferase family protein n=1 Tax=Brevibacillus sp. HD1.4A TaxID=2738978 RepID=UPI00156B859C|nr:arylamine N-acetyltransferase [Brevibacillus sp. HD1.4A]NRQ54236.1 arylamine N-acetyltransferase [Brevibacillus sp. HD1.4A]